MLVLEKKSCFGYLNVNYMNYYPPAIMEATAAIANDMTTAGPACLYATAPATRYTPTPRVDPMPSTVKSNVDRHLAKPESVDVFITFFLPKVFTR